MSFQPILAHGSFGSWDEVVFLSIAAIFLIVMGISWIRSRAAVSEEVEAEKSADVQAEGETSEHFPLK